MQKNIKGYEILRTIGTGGFGEVYVARQPLINRDVAIKVILPLYANRNDFIRRFEYEAQLVAKLEHPHIVPLYDYWRDPSGAYLVMRYIRGGNLADRLVTDGPFDMIIASKILNQIASALHNAHRNRVIHQDIKPANIILDEDDNAYLTDFGIARDIDSGVNLAEDESNTMHGSPKYISPEHLRRREILPTSDIYSLGILMYELLTGHAPFEHDDMLQLLQMHVRKDLPALQNHNPSLPAGLNSPLQQATLKDQSARYQSVITFAQDFENAVRTANMSRTSPIPMEIPMWESDDKESPTGAIEVRNPYKGLNAFQETDADDFYGREALVESLIESMKTPGSTGRFMAIVGASGSGKSSVVRAGLIPAVRAQKIEGLPSLYVSTMIPGSKPMRMLEGAILKVASRASVKFMQTISRDQYDLNEALKSSLPENGEMLLLIDQFEELFTLVPDEATRRNFMDLIHTALMADDSRLRVITTIRADFLDRPLSYADWGTLFRERMQLIPAMSQTELRASIEKPASLNGLTLADGLSDQLLDDVNAQRGMLPLLQYTLSELYERKSGIELTLEAYQEMGGMSGALAKRASEIFDELTESEQDVARLVFLRLVRIGGPGEDHTRQRVLRSDLYSLGREKEQIDTVVDTYGKYRLLTFDNETNIEEDTRVPTVEVVHEALIRSWDRLQAWIADNVDLLRLQARLSDATSLWVESGEESSFLVSGTRLEQFRTLEHSEIVALTKREQAFLQESIKAKEEEERAEAQRQQLLRLLRAGVFAFGIIAAIAAVIAFFQMNEAVQARDAEAIQRALADENALQSRARELAANSLLFAEEQPDTAILLALESLQIKDTFEGENALLAGLLTQSRLAGFFQQHEANVRTVAVSVDGSRLATGDQTGMIIIWDTETNRSLLTLEEHTGRVNVVAFHPDSNQIVSAGDQGQIFIWDIGSGEIAYDLSTDSEEIRAAAFSPDGTHLAVGNSAGQITWWETENYTVEETVTAHENGVIYDLAYSPDGTRLATGGDDNSVHIWSSDFSLENVISSHANWVQAVAFSPDSSRIASGTADRATYIWDAETGENIWAKAGHRAEVFALAFSDDGATLMSGALDDLVLFWDAETGDLLGNFPTFQRTGIRSLADFNNTLYIAGDTSDVVAINIGFIPRLGTEIASIEEDITALAIAPDGQIAFGGGTDDFAIYLQQEDSDTPSILELHENIVSDLAWDGQRLISVSVDRKVGLWQDGELSTSFEASDSIFSVAIYDNLLALGMNDGRIELWDISGEQADWSSSIIDGHTDRVNALDFSADGTRLVSGSRDETINIWDVAARTSLFEPLAEHTDSVEAVVFHPDGEIIASSSRDQTIILWDATTGDPLGPALTRHENWVNDLAFSPDGSKMISVSGDSSVIIWDTAQQRVLGLPLLAHSNWVNTVAFEPDGAHFVTSGRDGSLFRWQAQQSAWEAIGCDLTNRSLDANEIRDFFNEQQSPANVCNP